MRTLLATRSGGSVMDTGPLRLGFPSAVRRLNVDQAPLFVNSGYATERDWQIGHRYRNGQFHCPAGQLFGRDTQGHRYHFQSSNSKVYLPVGNCLLGHVDGPDAMALAFLNSADVLQMVGYTMATWYGYGGTSCREASRFIEQALGQQVAEKLTAEFHQTQAAEQHLHRLS
jgi:hypothetical protein